MDLDSEPPIAPRPDPYAVPPGGSPGAPGNVHGENKLAPLALASALASFVCLPGVGGLMAIGLGMAARSEMRRLPNRSGGSLALAAILLGGVNLLVSAVAAAVLLLWLSEMNAPWRTELPTASLVPPPTPAAVPRPVDKPVRVSRIGALELVDIRPHVRSLGTELDRQRAAAAEQDKRVLLWLVGPQCAPCQGVEAALPDPAMQAALKDVRLVRLVASDFQVELTRLRVPTFAIPGFALLGSTGRPIDYIHGGEWDDDVAENIAPVLSRFVRGEYVDRRYPWRGGVRDDETAL
ncbi:MAG: hypothetical protein GX607_02225 [Myxococcales bacterium]|jgi:hypothetical protein|nr:hypothetical protein [Myxococcales bacterium]